MDYLIENKFQFDAIITDPPYGTTGHNWDNIIPFYEMWDRVDKLIKKDGAIVLFGNEPFSSELRNSNKLMYRYDWKWIKTGTTGFQSVNYQPLRAYEDIMIFSKCGAVPQSKPPMKYYPQGLIRVNLKVKNKAINYLNKDSNKKKKEKAEDYVQEFNNYPRNVIQFKRDNQTIHPTEKPMNLMDYLILTYTKENELILDFTAGSGSTLASAERLKRKWVGIEISDKYCDVIIDRFKKGIQKKLDLDFN